MSAHPSIRIKSTWLVSQVQARAGIYMCPHVSAPFQVLTHASTSQYPNKKIHMTGIQGVSTCRHPDMLALVGNFSCVDTFTGTDTCQYIPSFKPKCPWDWYPRCRNVDVLQVLAPTYVSATFQVLTHDSTSQHPNTCIVHMINITGAPFQVRTSQLPNKKVHMIDIPSVGTCRYLDMSASAGTCRHFPRCQQPSMCWHMPTQPSIQIKSIWLISQVSAHVGTFSGVGTFEVLTHVSTPQLPNNIHMSARVGT